MTTKIIYTITDEAPALATYSLLPIIKAFSIVILGGLGSIGGSIIAALFLGYLETSVAYLISFNATELVPLIVIFITLIFRPAGIFGKGRGF